MTINPFKKIFRAFYKKFSKRNLDSNKREPNFSLEGDKKYIEMLHNNSIYNENSHMTLFRFVEFSDLVSKFNNNTLNSLFCDRIPSGTLSLEVMFDESNSKDTLQWLTNPRYTITFKYDFDEEGNMKYVPLELLFTKKIDSNDSPINAFYNSLRKDERFVDLSEIKEQTDYVLSEFDLNYSRKLKLEDFVKNKADELTGSFDEFSKAIHIVRTALNEVKQAPNFNKYHADERDAIDDLCDVDIVELTERLYEQTNTLNKQRIVMGLKHYFNSNNIEDFDWNSIG